mmetsp:Transcript_68779/g.222217  ORF Transcript_68779/g.222217 Transcript_68779/m.222217 type:complete len:237 (+) Transcript_68779:109-819(+)
MLRPSEQACAGEAPRSEAYGSKLDVQEQVKGSAHEPPARIEVCGCGLPRVRGIQPEHSREQQQACRDRPSCPRAFQRPCQVPWVRSVCAKCSGEECPGRPAEREASAVREARLHDTAAGRAPNLQPPRDVSARLDEADHEQRRHSPAGHEQVTQQQSSVHGVRIPRAGTPPQNRRGSLRPGIRRAPCQAHGASEAPRDEARELHLHIEKQVQEAWHAQGASGKPRRSVGRGQCTST